MASLADIFLPVGAPVNISAALSVGTGIDLLVQNAGPNKIRVETAPTAPTTPLVVGLLRNPGLVAQALPAAGELVFATSIGGDSTAHAETI